jgi:hypothetical protein
MTITREHLIDHIAMLTGADPERIERHLTPGATYTIDRDHPNGTWTR